LTQYSRELKQIAQACEEKYLKRRLGQQIKQFLSGEDVGKKIVAIHNKIQFVYVQCLVCILHLKRPRKYLTLHLQIILHCGTEVHLTSFESKLDLQISELLQDMSLVLKAKDEVRGDIQTILGMLQRMEKRTSEVEKAPDVQHQVSRSTVTTLVRLRHGSVGCFTEGRIGHAC
jgi:hypothetical protein